MKIPGFVLFSFQFESVTFKQVNCYLCIQSQVIIYKKTKKKEKRKDAPVVIAGCLYLILIFIEKEQKY